MRNRFLYFPCSELPSAKSLAAENMKLWQKTSADYRGLIADRDPPAIYISPCPKVKSGCGSSGGRAITTGRFTRRSLYGKK